MASKNQKTELTVNERLYRLEAEYNEVSSRLARLNEALRGKSEKEQETFIKKVGEEQYALLVEQQGYMMGYRDTLAKRIQLFKFEHIPFSVENKGEA
jgi:argininosuccinate lyase